MKKTLKIISISSILIIAFLWIASEINIANDFNSTEITNVLVVMYLFTSLKYYQMEVKDKNAEISELKVKLVKRN